jgi:hypothetical protein
MQFILTRESLNMGDDVDAPHYADVDVPDDANWGQVLDAVNATRYHHISAGKTVWKVHKQTTDGEILAVVSYDELCYVVPPETPVAELFPDARFSLHFSTTYSEPSAVRDALLAGRDG